MGLLYTVVGGDVRLRKAASSSNLDSSTSSTGSAADSGSGSVWLSPPSATFCRFVPLRGIRL